MQICFMWRLYFPPRTLSPWEACFSVVSLPSLLFQPGFYYSLWGREHSESSYSLMWLRLWPRLPAIHAFSYPYITSLSLSYSFCSLISPPFFHARLLIVNTLSDVTTTQPTIRRSDPPSSSWLEFVFTDPHLTNALAILQSNYSYALFVPHWNHQSLSFLSA